MTTIDRSKPVLVTGATGYVAGWLVKQLLEDGLTVHAAVRNPDNQSKLEHLNNIAASSKGTIKYFKSDLLEEGSYDEAAQGCEVVFHTASPFTLGLGDPQKNLIDPAVKGTENVLRAASKSESVKRVVLTSSCAAIYTDAIDTVNAPGGKITEAIWNETASLDNQPYSYSKTLAEKRAWEMQKEQSQWDLVAVNPCFVMGPALNPSTTKSESINILTQMGDGTMKMGVPNMGAGVVDVRDVATAHFRAAYTPEAQGRYITAGHNTSFLEMTQVLQPKYGKKLPLPKKAMPKWLVSLVGPILDKSITRKWVKNNVNIPWNADNSKIKNDLKMEFIPLQKTMEDSIEALIEQGILKTK